MKALVSVSAKAVRYMIHPQNSLQKYSQIVNRLPLILLIAVVI
jgi:hypothetical protein